MTSSTQSWLDPEDVCVWDIETKSDFQTWRMNGILYPATTNSTYPDTYSIEIDYQMAAEELKSLHEESYIITWNGSRFDVPYFSRKGDYFVAQHLDLMILFKLLFHDERKFSLDHWAHKAFGTGKIEIDYDHSSDGDIAYYLRNDLDLTWDLFCWVQQTDRFKSVDRDRLFKAWQLETRAAYMVQEQVDIGCEFDYKLAQKTLEDIDDRMEVLEHLLEPHMPTVNIPENKLDNPPKIQFKKDGTPSALLEKYLAKYDMEACKHGGVWKYKSKSIGLTYGDLPLINPLRTVMTLGPKDQGLLKEYLLSRGWQPTEWNQNKEKQRTSPRLTLRDSGEPCPALERMGIGWIPLLKEWLQARNRRNVLHSEKNNTGWIPYYEEHGVIPSDGDSLGANTGRWTHKRIANVPRPSSYYGKEFRSLFRAREGMVWVGWDASALEARVEGHYTHKYDPLYARELCDGDVHTRNLKNIPEVGDRDGAKKFKYAVTYGATPGKLASTFGWSNAEARIVYDDFWKSNPALSELRDSLNRHWIQRGRQTILGLDGRPICTRSEHSLLNALFQSAGAIIMKYAMLIARQRIDKEFPGQAVGLIRYHDEEVWECNEDIAPRVLEIGKASIVAAGIYLNLRVPLEADGKIGNTWADIH